MTASMTETWRNPCPSETELACCSCWLPAFLACCVPSRSAQREPVLKQIDVPHPYYFREMYLPQLTTGPECGGVGCGFPQRGVLHGGIAVAAEARLDRGRTTD